MPQRPGKRAISASLSCFLPFHPGEQRIGPRLAYKQQVENEGSKPWVLAQTPYLNNSEQVTPFLFLSSLVSLMIDNIYWGDYENQNKWPLNVQI